MSPTSDADRMQRLRVGVTGLAGVLLIVLLVTALAGWVQRLVVVQVPTVEVAGAGPRGLADRPSEPLAQLGAAPGADTSATRATRRP